MAIYSLHHSTISKATQERPYTASAHVEYITRARALTRVEGARMPTEQSEAVAFLNAGEQADRANGRVIDKLMLALPRELDGEQRVALICDFAEEVTQGRASWLAAFHEGGKDVDNPHVHLVIRDRDPATGRRVAQLSERGSTERLRQLWEDHANRALRLARRPERIDRRTLKAQGIKRNPTIHEGARARQLDRRRHRPVSQKTARRNSLGARSRWRVVDYPRIDGGETRILRNRQIRHQNIEREKAYWLEFDAVSRDEELSRLRSIHRPDQRNQSLIKDMDFDK
jgi:hypothetical protein